MLKNKFEIELVERGGLVGLGDYITNYGRKHFDEFHKQNLKFESGKVYGVISEYGQGCEFVSYLLGGRLREKTYSEQKILVNGIEVSKKELLENSWEIEPYKTKYEKGIVRKSIEKALKKGIVEDDFQAIAENFGLTESRYDMQLRCLSGERWFASMAIGYALGKRIFYAPYATSSFYMTCVLRFQVALEKLRKEDCLVILLCGTDRMLKHLVDECYVVDEFNYHV